MSKISKSKKSTTTSTTRALIKELDMNPAIKFKVEEAYKSIRANIMFSVSKNLTTLDTTYK